MPTTNQYLQRIKHLYESKNAYYKLNQLNKNFALNDRQRLKYIWIKILNILNKFSTIAL
jgi:hypothetical protein